MSLVSGYADHTGQAPPTTTLCRHSQEAAKPPYRPTSPLSESVITQHSRGAFRLRYDQRVDPETPRPGSPPKMHNTRQVAQRHNPDSRVTSMAGHLIELASAHSLMATDDHTTVIQADYASQTRSTPPGGPGYAPRALLALLTCRLTEQASSQMRAQSGKGGPAAEGVTVGPRQEDYRCAVKPCRSSAPVPH